MSSKRRDIPQTVTNNNPVYLNDNGSLDQRRIDTISVWETAAISGGAVTWAGSAMTLDTQGGAAADDLDTIAVGDAETGSLLLLRSTSEARLIHLRHLAGGSGNIWTGGGSLSLSHPSQIALLLYDGANWVVLACGCGSAGAAVEVTPDEGEDTACVIAARIIYFVNAVLSDAANARAGGVISVALALKNEIQLVAPSASPSGILALANLICEAYADETAILDAFPQVVFDTVQGYLYCANGDGTSAWDVSKLDALQAFLGLESGDAYAIVAMLFDLLGAEGITNAVATSPLSASAIDCSGSVPCSYSVGWQEAATNTLEGCTAKRKVVLHISGGGTLAAALNVDITVDGGTATGGGTDYTLVTTTVTFPIGSADGDAQEVQVNIAADALSDDNETIILGLDPDTGSLEGHAQHTLTIIAGGCSKTWSKTWSGAELGTAFAAIAGGTFDGTNWRISNPGSGNWNVVIQQVTPTTIRSDTTVTTIQFHYTRFGITAQTYYVTDGDGHTASGGLGCTSCWYGVNPGHGDFTLQIIAGIYTNGAVFDGYIGLVSVSGTGIDPFTGA